jgi:hypothetical protein
MESIRLPRFKLAALVRPIQLTERDRTILRLVHRHRFLRSQHIITLIGGGQQPLLRRLQLLYHHGYLERPRAQLEYFHRGGSRPIAYGLGSKGAALLKQELGSVFREVPWGEKNQAVGRMFLEHALLVSDVMVSLELACRKSCRVRLIYGEELSLRGEPRKEPFRWKVNGNGTRLSVVPDRVFALEFTDENGKSSRRYFFLEADRGTMSVKRRTLSQTSFYRKLLAYEATWSQAIHRSRFGFHRFRVLTVTTSAARVKSLVDACGELKRGHGLFLFTDLATFESAEDVLSLPWQTGRAGETTSLLS